MPTRYELVNKYVETSGLITKIMGKISEIKTLKGNREKAIQGLEDYDKKIESQEREIQQLQEKLENLKKNIVVDEEQLKNQISEIGEDYASKADEAYREREKLMKFLEKEEFKLKTVKEQAEKAEAEQICNNNGLLSLDKMLEKCKLFDSDENYLNRITKSKWISLRVPIILGVLFLVLFMVGTFVFNFEFLSVIANFIWWIVASTVLTLVSWLLAHLYAKDSFLCDSLMVISVVAVILLLIEGYLEIENPIFATTMLPIIYDSIMGIMEDNYWSKNKSCIFLCISFVLNLILIADYDLAWDSIWNSTMYIATEILIGALVFEIFHLLFTKTSCSKVVCLFYSADKLKCSDILRKIEETKMLYHIEDIIKIKIRQMAIHNICDETISAIEDEESSLDKLKKYNNIKKAEKNKLDTEIDRLETEVISMGKVIIGTKEYPYYEDEADGFESYVRTVIVPLGESFKNYCGQSDDLMRSSDGRLSDALYFEQYGSNYFPDFKIICHNCKKIVLLYDENEIPYGNLAMGLSDYVNAFAEAFLRINPTSLCLNQYAPIQRFCIIDFDSQGRAFAAANALFNVYSEPHEISSYLESVKQQRDYIIEEGRRNHINANIESFNRHMVKRNTIDGIKNYIITFILYGDSTRNNMETDEMWNFFNVCEQDGVIPIFFIDRKLWCNNDLENGIRNNERIVRQVPKENIYYISRADKRGNFYVNFTKYE